MGIRSLEGASAVGKTSTCRELEKNHGAFVISEVNFLFERPKNEHKTWYFEKQVERWNMAVQQSEKYDIVILDGDIFQPLSYNWCFHFEIFNQPLSFIEEFYKESMLKREIGFPDQYFYLYTTDEELRKRKDFDHTRKRRNFEKHIHIARPFQQYYQNLNNLAEGYCKLIEAKNVRTNEMEIMDSLQERKTGMAQRYNIVKLEAITNWLKENQA
ncbi:chloramphenicol acetyltransferase [Bacillus clarus]|uniref:AAA domain protein n=1 Tax=Bacillus clarus TaxID=2338372 RepID=A0A090Z0V5_9BACI|nr:chloramphenicol acetyltransferase [Bacillus clarus]KFN03805.1 AAA domain protein [Bacillus clarus]RFT67644.1 chloramphenicol acetyltransferase [Bacillus clarus]